MKKNVEFDDILNECLERVLFQGETLEQCLYVYPDLADELKPLLHMALVSREALAIKPSPEFRERAGYQFRAALHEIEAKKARGFLSFMPGWVVAVTAIFVILLASSGTVVTASGSLPDEPLYQVKLTTESIRLVLTPSDISKAELYVKLSDARVAEIVAMAEQGKTEEVNRTVERLDTQLAEIASLIVPENAQPATVKIEVAQAPEEPSQAQLSAPAPAPEILPRQSQQGVPQAPAEPKPMLTAPSEAGPSSGVGSSAEGDSGKVGKWAKLKQDLLQSAASNRLALQDVLEKVPESARPAILQAIQSVDTGYEEALSNLD